MVQILTPLNNKKMTVGEKRFINLLERYLDNDYLCWFDLPTPSHIQRFPDIILLHPKMGLLCLEIKDWYQQRLVSANSEKVSLNLKTGEDKIVEIPHLQARNSLLPLINKIAQDKTLLQTGKYLGHLKFPWGYGGVMTNWNKEWINKQGLETIFSDNRYFFKEDLLDEKITKESFKKKLHSMMQYQFETSLTQQEIDKIRSIIFPEIKIHQMDLFQEREEDIVYVMDYLQEKEARSLGGGHRVIHGVAGSGKTVLLRHRAKVLSKRYPNEQILVICYNASLAHNLKRYFLSSDEKNIEVHTLHTWCNKYKYYFHINFQSKDIDLLPNTVCQAILNEQIPIPSYAAVLIDEGHDLNPIWLSALAKCPQQPENHLLLLYDGAQNIYQKEQKVSLLSMGINARGRTKILHKNYRNSQEIADIAQQFLTHFKQSNENVQLDEGEIPLCRIEIGGQCTHLLPQCHVFREIFAEFEDIVRQIDQWIKQGVAFRDIGILYPTNYFADQLLHYLTPYFPCAFLRPKWNSGQKDYFKEKNAIGLSTYHSAKGNEFRCVIVAGVGNIPSQFNDPSGLLYVAMTRAREQLLITSSGRYAINNYVKTLQKVLAENELDKR